MATKREIPGLADVIATIISPIFIMALVGALVFFLLEVLYGGDYVGRLRWTFFFYVFGSVLVARISIEFGDAKASLYAVGLGLASLVAMWRFVEYPPGWVGDLAPLVNIGLLVLVWWSAYKLTWDCTFVDDNRDGSDQSLLEATGLDQLERPEELREPETPEDAPSVNDASLSLIDRIQRWREARRKKPHTPGKWVVYFSLAALPLFGLGQSLIPVEEGESRRFAFWLMVVYVGSGLALLMTTAFLGLRRYLKQRKLQIPPAMAGMWLGLGGALILAFLTIAAVLPRPNSETPLVDVSGMIGSKSREASRFSPHGDGKGEGDGAGGDEQSEDAQSQSSVEGKSKEGGKGKGQDDATKGSGENKGKGTDGGKSDQSGGQKGNDQKGEKGDQQNQRKDPNDQKSNESDNNKSENKGSPNRSKTDSARSKSSSQRNSRSSSPKGPMSISSLGWIGKAIKWIVFAILALVVGYFIFRHGLKFLANFSTWARQLLDFLNNFWARLFGGTTTEAESAVVEDFANFQRPARPFADFSNPFDNGQAGGWSPEDLVKYSFSALEAWAFEHSNGRNPEETPLEFAKRLADEYQSLEREAPRIAALYARLAYARGRLPEACREQVAEFWRQLELAQDAELESRRTVTVDS